MAILPSKNQSLLVDTRGQENSNIVVMKDTPVLVAGPSLASSARSAEPNPLVYTLTLNSSSPLYLKYDLTNHAAGYPWNVTTATIRFR